MPVRNPQTPEQAEERRRYHKNRHLTVNYGITLEEWEAIIADQGGKCPICQRGLNGEFGTHADHRHSDGVLRGALCSSCNRGLGLFRDDADVLMRAAKYLMGVEGRYVG